MKTRNYVLIAAAFCGFFLSVAIARNNVRGETRSPAQAEKAWGKQRYSAEDFRTGSFKTKAAMASEIVERRLFIGTSVAEVEKALGRHDAYYKNDFIPAYGLNEGWKTGEDTWQLVFLPDENMKIKDVFIHKNCCQ